MPGLTQQNRGQDGANSNPNVERAKEDTQSACASCQKPEPVEICLKSLDIPVLTVHSNCKGKLFCDMNCNISYHKSEIRKVFFGYFSSLKQLVSFQIFRSLFIYIVFF